MSYASLKKRQRQERDTYPTNLALRVHRALKEQQWKAKFERAKVSAHRALAIHNTVTVLATVLSRMYTLRNQLMHGGATWNSSVNRDQLRDCSAFLGKMVPFVIKLMMDNPRTLWGAPCYPVVDAPRD